MLTRRQLGRLVVTAAAAPRLFSPGTALAVPAVTPLFIIARSKNRNIVRYCPKVQDNGLNLRSPIDAHWLMLAEDGRREELTWTERKLAYGFELSDVTAERCRMTLSACKRRSISVERAPHGFRALIQIAGQRAVLDRLFVQATDGLIPSVSHVDLFGKSLSGAALTERILP